MATFNKFSSFVEALAEKTHNLGSDTLKIMLTNSAPSAANTIKSNLTEISGGQNNYTSGGATVTITGSLQVGGVYTLGGSDVIFTSTGTIGPFRYPVLYNDTAASKELIGYWDYGSSISLNSGETFTVDFGTAILTLV